MTMKRLAITTFVLGALVMGFSAQPAQADVSVRVTIGGFYDELAPYGRWVNCRYGRCWVPRRVARRWQPYTNGRWVYTEYGWTWVSRDPWGGSPYHYGTWINLRGYGWSWVPGTVWAPAWVTWSYSDRYVGWAPLPPSVVFGESGYAGRPVVVSQTQYVFVPTNRFVDTDVTSVRVSAQESATIFRQTTPVTHFGVSDGIVRNTGIPMETVQRATGGRIETHSISAANTTPRSMTAGGSGKSRQVAIVAPAREVNAAVAAKPQGTSRPAASSKAEKGGKAQVSPQKAPKARKAPPAQSRGQAARSPQSRQQSTAPRAAPKPQKAPKARQAPPAQSHGQAAQSPQSRQQSTAPRAAPKPQKAPKAQKAPPAQSHGQPAQAAPAQRRQEPPPRAEANPARPAPAPAAQAAPPKQGPGHEKPAKKEKEKDKKDEKH
jgi:hypothetical protein